MPKPIIKQVPNIIGAADSANFIGIFTQIFMQILSEFAKQIMFPFAAFTSIIQAILTYRQLYLEKGKERSTVFRAVVQTVSAIAITLAVIGGLVLSSIFAMAAPIIFTVVTGVNTLINFGTACYYWGKHSLTQDPEDYNKARDYAIASLAGTLATLGVGFVMLGGWTACAVFGIASGVVGTIFSLVNIYKTYKKSQLESAANRSNAEKSQEESLIRGDNSEMQPELSQSENSTKKVLGDVAEEEYKKPLAKIHTLTRSTDNKSDDATINKFNENTVTFDMYVKRKKLEEKPTEQPRGIPRSNSF